MLRLGFLLINFLMAEAFGQASFPAAEAAYQGENVTAIDLVANPHVNVEPFRTLLAQEVGEYNIRVNCISAAAVKGDRFVRVIQGRANALGISFDEALGREMVNYSLKRPAEEYELANCAVYLASDESSAVTGQTIVNHCGQHIAFK